MRFFALNLPLFVVLLSLAVTCSALSKLKTVYQWKTVDFLWNSDKEREQAVKDGSYDFSRNILMDVEKAKDGRVFVSLVGAPGVPARLATVSEYSNPDSGPLLRPYPDWTWHRAKNCEGITSVYRMAIDKCDRLWVLDTGLIEGTNIPPCPHQLLAFDLNSNFLINRVIIPNNIARDKDNNTLLSNPIVETEGPFCENTTVYIADTFGRGLIVYHNGHLKRFESPLFGASINAINFTLNDANITLTGGILGLSLSPKIFPGEPHFLYLRPLASFDLFAISTNNLKNFKSGEDLNFLGERNVLSSQAVGQAFSKEGTLFLGLTREMAIACYNRYTKLTKNNIVIVARDPEALNYINSVKVVPAHWYYNTDEELWALSNKFVHFNLGMLSASDYNYRILAAPVKNLVAGTKCKIPEKTVFHLEEIDSEDGHLAVEKQE